jgi:hypothetical protein
MSNHRHVRSLTVRLPLYAIERSIAGGYLIDTDSAFHL